MSNLWGPSDNLRLKLYVSCVTCIAIFSAHCQYDAGQLPPAAAFHKTKNFLGRDTNILQISCRRDVFVLLKEKARFE